MIRIKTPLLGLLVPLIMFGGIGASMLAGAWNVSSTKQPALIKTGDFAGLPSPSDIRGSYTWADVSSAFGIPVESLMEAFGAVSGTEKVNSLETLYSGKVPEGMEIGTDSVRLFVSLMTAIPHEIEEGTILPASAIPVLSRDAKADTALIEAAVNRSIAALSGENPISVEEPGKTAVAPPATTAGTEPLSPAPQAASAPAITGKTTFQNLKDAGFDMRKVQEITGTVADMNESIKTFCETKGIEFSDIKAKLAEF